MRWLVDLAHPLRRRAMAMVGWRTRGVKVMVFDQAGRLLLVRHRYGRQDLWMLPGGGIDRRETPAEAAVREIAEETGCGVYGLEVLGTFLAGGEGRRDTVCLFRAVTPDHPVADPGELLEARMFAMDALPDATSPATRRRIDEMAGLRSVDGRW